MSVLSAAEQDVMDDFAAGITVPRPRAAAGFPAGGGYSSRPGAAKRRPGSAQSPTPAGRVPGGRELRIRQVRVSEVRVSEMGRGQSRLAGPGMPGSGRSAGLRLTRRGRVVLAGLAIVIVTAVATAMLFWLSAAGNAQAAGHGQLPGAAHRGLSPVVVRPGQTLWFIARRAEPSADPRVVVQQIIEVNALGSPVIQPGELLWVPKG